MVAIGCGIDGYIELKPLLSGSLGTTGATGGDPAGFVVVTPPLLTETPPPPLVVLPLVRAFC